MSASVGWVTTPPLAIGRTPGGGIMGGRGGPVSGCPGGNRDGFKTGMGGPTLGGPAAPGPSGKPPGGPGGTPGGTGGPPGGTPGGPAGRGHSAGTASGSGV